jgi:hypothetical protein
MIPTTILSSLTFASQQRDDPAVGLFDLSVPYCSVYAITHTNDKYQIDQMTRQATKSAIVIDILFCLYYPKSN